MKKNGFVFFSLTIIWVSFFLFHNNLFARENANGELVNQILSDVIDRTVNRADEVVRQKTGIYHPRPDYKATRHEETYPEDLGTSGETNREFVRLNEEHDRKMRLLNEQLDRKLEKYEEQFRKQAGKEKKRDNIRKKRALLEQKVDKAYSKFNEKIKEENLRYERKKEQIVRTSHKKQKGKKDKAWGHDKGNGKGHKK